MNSRPLTRRLCRRRLIYFRDPLDQLESADGPTEYIYARRTYTNILSLSL